MRLDEFGSVLKTFERLEHFWKSSEHFLEESEDF